MAFELFTKKKLVTTEPSVSILKSGNIFVNAKCIAEFLPDKRYVNLLFDRKEKILGIQPIDRPERHSYSIRQGAKKSGAAISGTSFLRYFDIKHQETKTYPATWNEKNKLVEVRLK